MADALDIEMRRVNEIIWREDLYPRIKPDTATIQRYAANLEVLPPIEINQHNILIDGYHRWTAHRKAEAERIGVIVTPTESEREVRLLANKRNSSHGLQTSEQDKKREAVWLYAAGTGSTKEEIADALSVTVRMVNNYLSDIDKQLREERKQKIFDMWLECHTLENIGDVLGIDKATVSRESELCCNLEEFPKSNKVHATFSDPDFTPPLYNVWRFSKNSNEVVHFGNSEQHILENLLYLYTEPFDIVLDPFGGGGATIDICRKRLRRYWCSDRKPTVIRERDIRKLDIVAELPPLHNRWSDVTLTYLDPPYWKQAERQYSNDPEDLANMSLEAFTRSLANVITRIAAKQSRGAIALLMQPTQWKADNREFTDHVIHIVNAVGNKRLILENRVSCPYSSEQYNAQQVEWAKTNKKLLVITRELIVWRVGNAGGLGSNGEKRHQVFNANAQAGTLPGIM